jgi:hypothetical protein
LCGVRESPTRLLGSFRYRLSRKREEGVDGAYGKMKGGWEPYWTVHRESTELHRVVLVVERDQTVCVGTSTSLLKKDRPGGDDPPLDPLDHYI